MARSHDKLKQVCDGINTCYPSNKPALYRKVDVSNPAQVAAFAGTSAGPERDCALQRRKHPVGCPGAPLTLERCLAMGARGLQRPSHRHQTS